MGHAADAIHDRSRGIDVFAFHEEYAKLDSGLDDRPLDQKRPSKHPRITGTHRVLDFSSRKSLTGKNLRLETAGIEYRFSLAENRRS